MKTLLCHWSPFGNLYDGVSEYFGDWPSELFNPFRRYPIPCRYPTWAHWDGAAASLTGALPSETEITITDGWDPFR